MSEEEEESDESYNNEGFSSIEDKENLQLLIDLGVNPLEMGLPPANSKKVKVDSSIKICDNIDDNIVCEQTGPIIINSNQYLYRHSIHSLNHNSSELNLSTLPDEILLSIVQYLSHKSLCNLSEVSRRMYTVANDESLWQRIDLSGYKLNTNWLMYILKKGVKVVKLTGAEIESPVMSPQLSIELINFQSKIEYLDLSEVTISIKDLQILLSKCRMLRKLSLESCNLNEDVCCEIAENFGLNTLNLCMCSGMTSNGITNILAKCQSLESLNICWTGIDKVCVQELVLNITPKIRKLNLSGLWQSFRDKHLIKLVKRCQEIVELDLSDCLEISEISIHCIVKNLGKLKSLSISRCYKINPTLLSELSILPHFRRLNAFRLITSDLVAREGILPNVGINKEYLSAIARPTVGYRKSSTIWNLKCHK